MFFSWTPNGQVSQSPALTCRTAQSSVPVYAEETDARSWLLPDASEIMSRCILRSVAQPISSQLIFTIYKTRP